MVKLIQVAVHGNIILTPSRISFCRHDPNNGRLARFKATDRRSLMGTDNKTDGLRWGRLAEKPARGTASPDPEGGGGQIFGQWHQCAT